MVKVTYLGHSGFLAELPEALLLFDYYIGSLPELPADKPLYVFVSHRHGDHFNPAIFRLTEKYGQVTFFLSHDIRLTPAHMERWGIGREDEGKIRSLKPRENYRVPGLGTVETLKSTDEGVAFLVTVNETVLYHAGDLNWWLWKGEDKGWLGNMTANFKREIARIAGRRIDLAFLPLDDRQGEYFYKGMDWFLRSCRVRYAFPMHFWEDGSVVRRFELLPCRKDYSTVVCSTADEREWELAL
mgnify:FL=1